MDEEKLLTVNPEYKKRMKDGETVREARRSSLGDRGPFLVTRCLLPLARRSEEVGG